MTALEKNKDGIPHLYKFYISLFFEKQNSMVCTLKNTFLKEDRYKEI